MKCITFPLQPSGRAKKKINKKLEYDQFEHRTQTHGADSYLELLAGTRRERQFFPATRSSMCV